MVLRVLSAKSTRLWPRPPVKSKRTTMQLRRGGPSPAWSGLMALSGLADRTE